MKEKFLLSFCLLSSLTLGLTSCSDKFNDDDKEETHPTVKVRMTFEPYIINNETNEKFQARGADENSADLLTHADAVVRLWNVNGEVKLLKYDKDIVSTELVSPGEGTKDSDFYYLKMHGVKVGKCDIILADDNGNDTLKVEVNDIEGWFTSHEVWERTGSAPDYCDITGVNKDVAAEIEKEVLQNKAPEYQYVMWHRDYAPYSGDWIIASDKEKKVLYDYKGLSENKIIKNYEVKDAEGKVLKKYVYHFEPKGNSIKLVQNLSADYAEKYPGIQVLVYIDVKQVKEQNE